MSTPISEHGRRIYDGMTPEQAIMQAWTCPGPNAEWHIRQQEIVRKSMPLLARALDRMAKGDK